MRARIETAPFPQFTAMDPLRSKRVIIVRWAVHCIGAAVLLLMLLGYALLSRSWRLEATNADIAAERHERQIRSADRAFVAADLAQTKLHRLTEQAADIRSRIPQQPEDSAFLTAAAEMADAVGVELIDYRRIPGSGAEPLPRVQLQLRVLGNYDALCRYLHDLETADRLVRIDHLQLQTIAEQPQYPCEIRVVLYYGREIAEEAAL
jgi:Tfp pilus assembly protein PilO